MRILVTNDDGIHAPGPGHRGRKPSPAALSDDVSGGGAGKRTVRASHSCWTWLLAGRLRQVRERRYGRYRHADRLRDDGLPAYSQGPAARTGAVGESIPAPTSPTMSPIPARRRGRWKAAPLAFRPSRSNREPAVGARCLDNRLERGWRSARPRRDKAIAGGRAGRRAKRLNLNFPGVLGGRRKVTWRRWCRKVITICCPPKSSSAPICASAPISGSACAATRSKAAENSDLGAIHAGRISVTPLHLNLTEHDVLKKMRENLGQISLKS